MVHRQEILVIYTCVMNVFSDLASREFALQLLTGLSMLNFVIVMALPLGMLKSLQMRTAAKVGLAGVFCCASITIIFDILRAVETDTKGGVKGSTALWTNLESAVAVIVSCLPSFTALFSSQSERYGGRNRSPYKQRSLVISDSAKLCVSAGSSVKCESNACPSATGTSEKGVSSRISMQEPVADRLQSKESSIV